MTSKIESSSSHFLLIKTINNVLMKAKPSTVKGVYVKNISIATTMGPGIKVDPATI